MRRDAIEQEYRRFCERRRRDIAFKELLLEYIAAHDGMKAGLESITAADLVEWSNRATGRSPLLPGEMDKRF